jgi:O-antigen/teichoic acid export membrane protein
MNQQIEATPAGGAGQQGERLRRGRGRGGGRQMLKNLWTNFLAITIQMILGMLLTRYLIRTLGPAEYSVVPLSFQLMTFFTLITSSVNASVGRYLTIEMTRGELDAARRTFNSSFWGMMIVFSVLVPAAVAMAWLSPHFLNFAEGAVAESQRVLLASAISFFIITTSSTLMVSAFARNRLDLQNYVRIGWHVIRVSTPFALIGWFGWGLDGVSVGIVLGALTHFTLSVRTWRKLNPELTLRPKWFSKKRFWELTDMSIWLMLDKIGRVLQFNASIVVVNLILGAAAAGRYGAIMIFGRSLILYNRSMRLVATPVIYAMYGRGDYEHVKRFLISFVRFEGIMLALPLAGLIVLAEPLLTIWLGPQYADLAPVVIWMMIGLIMTMPNVPVRIIFAATKKVRVPGILSMSVGIINIMLSIYMIHPDWGLGMGLVAVPLSALFTTQLKNFLFPPLYAAHVMKIKWYTYFIPFLRIAMSYAFVLGVAYGLRWLFNPDSWMDLIWIGLITAIVYLPVGLFVFMTKEDRSHVKQVRKRRGRRGQNGGQNGDQNGTVETPDNDLD